MKVKDLLKSLPDEQTFLICCDGKRYPQYAIGDKDHVLNRGRKDEKVYPALPMDKVDEMEFADAVVTEVCATSPCHMAIRCTKKFIEVPGTITVDTGKYTALEKAAYTTRQHVEDLISDLLSAQSQEAVIKYLLYVGFRPEELTEYGFYEGDIEDAVKEMDNLTDCDSIRPDL